LKNFLKNSFYFLENSKILFLNAEEKETKTEELSLKERLRLLNQGKIALMAIGVGLCLTVFVAWTTIIKAKQEMATIKQDVPVPTTPSFKEDSSKVNNKLSHLNSADETIKKKNERQSCFNGLAKIL
jgi:hypothetical protein